MRLQEKHFILTVRHIFSGRSALLRRCFIGLSNCYICNYQLATIIGTIIKLVSFINILQYI